MFEEILYKREAVADYAETWAFFRNPRYFDFENLGGDCTNFASQCIYAGCPVMNYKRIYGWYYKNLADRTPSWSGVEFLHRFLVENKGQGPYAVETDKNGIEIGDIVQLSNRNGRFYHSPVVVGKEDGEIYVAAHTFDAYYRPLSSYIYDKIRYLHILGGRIWID